MSTRMVPPFNHYIIDNHACMRCSHAPARHSPAARWVHACSSRYAGSACRARPTTHWGLMSGGGRPTRRLLQRLHRVRIYACLSEHNAGLRCAPISVHVQRCRLCPHPPRRREVPRLPPCNNLSPAGRTPPMHSPTKQLLSNPSLASLSNVPPDRRELLLQVAKGTEKKNVAGRLVIFSFGAHFLQQPAHCVADVPLQTCIKLA